MVTKELFLEGFPLLFRSLRVCKLGYDGLLYQKPTDVGEIQELHHFVF